ncbi:minichromosome maintenance protein MCM [Natronorubrum texcoconense]|uniref:MCM2/3/5 family protein n=1 Tax=Natronorubrum texcoconense TaxID=1095776 RepID=A0A1G9HBE2_9EURY|nr:minichromosome maintenance protein MCM [Natronorubrum texcoconense]SDL10338.1 MCM2/3/5 family protein [Natronorubrum texcoconense]
MGHSSSGRTPQTLANEHNMFDRLCETISLPGIDSKVVQASVLQLVGGSRHERNVGAAIRGDIHLAAVVDASVNLSRFISVLEDLSQSPAHLNGTSTTLTGAVGTVKGGSLTPGPLLDREVSSVFIERFDSTNSNVSEALQQILDTGSYSFTKSNYRSTVSAPGSVFIGLNPKYGSFDDYEPIGDQLPLTPGVAQAVDLVISNTQDSEPFESAEKSLPGDVAAEYIQATTTIEPRFTTEATETIDSYLSEYESTIEEMENSSSSPLLFSPDRVRESMHRLAEAHAKSNLESEVTAENAGQVLDLVKSVHSSIGIDTELNTGTYDGDVVEAGTSKSQRDRIKNLKQVISDIETRENAADPELVLERADEIGMNRTKAEHEIEKLKQKGEIYSPPHCEDGALRTT